MYYQSMRRPYLQLAEELSIPIAIVEVMCDTTTCIQRNRLRPPEQQVPEHIIHRMSDRIEWCGPRGGEHKIALKIEHSGGTLDDHDDVLIQQILTHVLTVYDRGPRVRDDATVVKVADEASSKVLHVHHECDLVLRKLVSQGMKSSSGSDDELISKPLLAAQLQEKRLNILKHVVRYFPSVVSARGDIDEGRDEVTLEMIQKDVESMWKGL
eukprot:PhF_6_TR5496/c0_g1_i2/m.7767/K10837/PSTK; O-phosphoseryl-tRNA(Sec) kinase